MSHLPLITCMMPTGNRRAFVALSIACFRAQTYPCKELVVIDDGEASVGDLCDGVDVRHVRVPPGTSIGAKRNRAIELGRGSIFVQWDDDDWYAPERLGLQAVPLLLDGFDMVGLVPGLVFDVSSGRFWRMTAALEQRIFRSGLHSGTLAFTAELLAQGLHYTDSSTGEDVDFVQQAKRVRARIGGVAHADAFVYVRHHANAWAAYRPGVVELDGWRLAERPARLAASVAEAFKEAAREARLVPRFEQRGVLPPAA